MRKRVCCLSLLFPSGHAQNFSTAQTCVIELEMKSLTVQPNQLCNEPKTNVVNWAAVQTADSQTSHSCLTGAVHADGQPSRPEHCRAEQIWPLGALSRLQ